MKQPPRSPRSLFPRKTQPHSGSRAASTMSRPSFPPSFPRALPWAAAGLLALTAAQAQPTSSWRVATAEPSAATTLWCGLAPLQVEPVGPGLSLTFGGKTQMVMPAISASGARYTGPEGSDTEFWNKGELATLTWDGQTPPTCAPAGAVVTPFRSSGNEPFWAVEYDGWTLTVSQPGSKSQPLPAEVTERGAEQTVITTGPGAEAFRLTVRDGVCQDTMSGMPHPQTVRLEHAGTTWQGCGGDPGRLFQGVEWQILSIDGKPLPADGPVPTIYFGTDGRLNGFAGCNRFMGGYALSGEGLTSSQLASTRMACIGAGDALETRILGHLEQLQGFEAPAAGTLTLRTGQGTLGARLASGHKQPQR